VLICISGIWCDGTSCAAFYPPDSDQKKMWAGVVIARGRSTATWIALQSDRGFDRNGRPIPRNSGHTQFELPILQITPNHYFE
jgi:hypothetical protein